MNVLLFDEEVLLANEIEEGLMLRDSSIKFYSATSYKNALSLVQGKELDVILIDVVIPFTDEDKRLNENLTNNQNTGIAFKNHLLRMVEDGKISKPKMYFFSARTNIREEDIKDIDGIIYKPKRPSQIYQQLTSK